MKQITIICSVCGHSKPQEDYELYIYDMVDPEDAICNKCRRHFNTAVVKIAGYETSFGSVYVHIHYFIGGEIFRKVYCPIDSLPIKISLSSLAKCLRKRRANNDK